MAEQNKMAEQSKTADYFGTFLDAVKSQEEGEQEPNDRLRSILLAVKPNPLPLWDLQKAVGLPFPDFTSELESARVSGYLDVEGPSGEERVSLTASGRELASRLER